MTTKFIVSVAFNHMKIDVMQSRPSVGWRDKWRQFSAYLQGDTPPNLEVVKTVVVQGNTSVKGLPLVFQTGLDILKKHPEYPLSNAEFEIILGASLARVGCLEMGQGDGVSEDGKTALSNAWITQNWNLGADDCVVCSAPVGESGRHLISCIEQTIIDALNIQCEHEGIRLSACRPALVVCLDEILRSALKSDGAEKANPIRFCVFLEKGLDGGRSNIVQFVALDSSGPVSIARMWLPFDAPVDNALARFCSQYKTDPQGHVTWLSWPDVTPGTHSVS